MKSPHAAHLDNVFAFKRKIKRFQNLIKGAFEGGRKHTAESIIQWANSQGREDFSDLLPMLKEEEQNTLKDDQKDSQ